MSSSFLTDVRLKLTLTCYPLCENTHHLLIKLIIRHRVAMKERRCFMVSTTQNNMPTTLEDSIFLMHEELKQVDPLIPSHNLGKIAAAYMFVWCMFGAAEALRSNPNGPQEKLSLLMVNDEAGDLEPEILERFLSRTTEIKEDVHAVCMSELSNNANNVREMPCLHQYHEDCICKWLKCNQSCPICQT
ncbi:hypothetical protein AMTRI_Chr01g132800 [Amborella trichopoda]